MPRKTLDDRIKGRIKHGCKPGPSTALTAEEESVLTAYLLYMAEHGFPLTSNMAMGFACAVSLRFGTQDRFNADSGPGKHCWRSFRSRHPELTLRTADNLECSRANALTRDVVNSYFDCHKVTLEQYNLVNALRQLFNCDETFLSLNISCKKVVARWNANHVYGSTATSAVSGHTHTALGSNTASRQFDCSACSV